MYWTKNRVRYVRLMGVVNLTDDSFHDGGRYLSPNAAIERCRTCVAEGAAILDLGAESTRPGSEPVSAIRQIDRLLPLVRILRRSMGAVTLSVDTSDPEVMEAALAKGVDMINDVCALEKEGALEVAGRFQPLVCLMHKKGDPQTMQNEPRYQNVVAEVRRYLFARALACLERDIPMGNLILDPGLGFGKTTDHNYTLLANLHRLRFANLPLLVGASRKTMIAQTLNVKDRADTELRLEGSLVAHSYAVWRGANIIRTHDVGQTKRAIRMSKMIARYHQR